MVLEHKADVGFSPLRSIVFRFHLLAAAQTADGKVGPAPRVLSAGAAELDLTIRAGAACKLCGLKIEMPTCCGELRKRNCERTAGHDVMRHVRAGFLAADSSSARWVKADALHFRGPLFIVVCAI